MSKKKEELEESKSAEVAVVDQNMEMFMEDSQIDDGIDQSDCAIPRLSLLQSNSPQCAKGNAKYIKGAEAGDLFDSVNQKIFKGEDGVTVIPCHFRKTFLEWHDRDSKDGAGFVADHGNDPSVLDACVKNDKNKFVTEAGTIVEETAEYYVLLLDEDGIAEPYVLSMKSSGLTVSRKWNSLLKLAKRKNAKGVVFKPAMFYMSFTITTLPQSKDDYTWMNWSVNKGEDVPALEGGIDLYTQAKALHEAVASGQKKANNEESEEF